MATASRLPLTPIRKIAMELHNELGVIHGHLQKIELDISRRGLGQPGSIDEMRAALQRAADLTKGLFRY